MFGFNLLWIKIASFKLKCVGCFSNFKQSSIKYLKFLRTFKLIIDKSFESLIYASLLKIYHGGSATAGGYCDKRQSK